ncbi:MAG: cytochrome c oxidase subunit 2 [Kiritimatiellia bacterium]|jgi:cytochrome c oxidase subunit II
MKTSFRTFPEAQSQYAEQVDWLYAYLNIVSLVFCVLVMVLIIVFAVKFKRKSQDDRVPWKHEGFMLEIVGSVVPFFLIMVMFVWGTKLYFNHRVPPEDAMEILVTGKQWMWKIQHPNGRKEINELHVPVGVPIKLTMTSEDVIHSFFIPNLRIKADVLFGRYTRIWFNADKTGNSHLFCAEYCGTEHSKMVGTVYIMPASEYEDWVSGESGLANVSPVEAGEALFAVNCASCHHNGSESESVIKTGPSMVGLFGREEEMKTGEKIMVDEDYLHRSIMNPAADIVKGFTNVQMPMMGGQLTEQQIFHLIEYIKSLKASDDTAKQSGNAGS